MLFWLSVLLGAKNTTELDPKDPGQFCNTFPILSWDLYDPLSASLEQICNGLNSAARLILSVFSNVCLDRTVECKTIPIIWTTSSEFGTYRLCEQRRFRRACASAQSRQNLRCSLIQAVSQEEPSDRKPDPSPLWMAGHAQLKFVMTECSKTQIRLTGPI